MGGGGKKKQTNKLHSLSPQLNYTNRATTDYVKWKGEGKKCINLHLGTKPSGERETDILDMN
jgi:hypothetical protein